MGGVKVAQLYAALGLDKKAYETGLSQAESSSRGWGSRIGGIFKTAGKAIAVGLAVGIAAIGVVGAKGLEAASTLQESQSKVEQVFGDEAAAILDWSKNSSTAFGQSQAQALEAAGTYGNLFQAFGLGRAESTEMSKSLVELAADLASFNNTSVDDALVALRSGLSGETEPLKRYGIAVSDARMRTELLAQGFTDLPTVLTPAMKAQAAYGLIMKDSTLAQGDFARTADGVANQQRIAAATFQNVLAQLGTAVIPIANMILPMLVTALETFGTWVTENGPAIQATIETVVGVIGNVLTFLFENVIPVLIDVFNSLFGTVQDNMPGISATASEVFGAVQEIIGVIVNDVLPPLMAVFSALVGWVADNWPTISSVFGQVFGAVRSIISAVWPVVERVGTVLFPIVGAAATVLFSALDFAFKAIGGVFEVFGAVAKAVFQAVTAIWDGIGGFFRKHLGGVGTAFKGAVNFIIDIVNGFLGFLNNLKIDIPRIDAGPIQIGGGSIDPFNFNLIPRLATGTPNFGGGLAWVGEHGPELVNLPGGSRVHNAADSRGMMNGRVTVELRDPDGAVARGGYSQRDIERAVEAGIREFLGTARHAGARA